MTIFYFSSYRNITSWAKAIDATARQAFFNYNLVYSKQNKK